jgi:hypothetical protein
MHHLTDNVRCSPSFIREMDAQLAAQFREKTKLDIAEFVLAPNLDMFSVRRNGPVGYIECDIVGSYYGFGVTIAWAHIRGERFIEPHDQVTAENVRFWWHVLPVDEIVAEEQRWPEPPFDVVRFSFTIDYKLKVWPHVRFTLGLREPANDDARARLDATISKSLYDDWFRDGHRGTFHDVGVAEPVDERTVKIDIDLGSTDVEGMVFILDRLAATSLVASISIRAY